MTPPPPLPAPSLPRASRSPRRTPLHPTTPLPRPPPQKREEEARKHPQKDGEEGGKKKKGADKEDDGPHKPSVRERRQARDAWHAEHVLHQAACESCGKPKAPGHTHAKPAAAAKSAAH
jgi:hypothetical protein